MIVLAQATQSVGSDPVTRVETTNSTLSPGTPGTVAQGTQEPPALVKYGQYLPLILGILILYFFIFRSRKNQDKAKQKLLSTMKKGDRVQTIGGILGTIVEARENEIVLKVDETSNTKIRFTRAAIHKVVEEEK